MKVRIVMNSGKEYIVESSSKANNIEQFIWMHFEKNNSLINQLIRVKCEGTELAINPTHISSLELVHN